MYHTEASVFIAGTPEEIFAVLTDLNRFREWQVGLSEARWTSEGAPGLESTYVFVTRFAGSSWDLPGAVTAWEPATGWQWKASGGPFPVQGGYRLEPREGGVLVTMFSDSQPSGLVYLLRPLFKGMGERSYRRSFSRLRDLMAANAQLNVAR